MSIEEKKIKIYESILNNEELTSKKLEEIGYSKEEIDKLEKNDLLEKESDDSYRLKTIEELLQYGKLLLQENNFEKATACFDKCFMISPTNREASLQLLFRMIQNRNFQRSFEILEVLSNNRDELFQQDLNYYLFLLSNITEVPERFKNMVKTIKLYDISIPKDNTYYEDVYTQNIIRKYSIQKKFAKSLFILNKTIQENSSRTISDAIIKSLLIKATESEQVSRNEVFNYIKEKEYDKIRNHFLEKQNNTYLSAYEEYLLLLASKYEEIKENGKELPKKYFKEGSLKEAIETNNFELALRMNQNFNNVNGIEKKKSAINLMLEDIMQLIKSLSEKKIEERNTNQKENNSQELSSILNCLQKKEIDSVIAKIYSYLHSVNKENYEFMVFDLIKISLIEKDFSFTEPMLALTLIHNNQYQFDFSKYLKKFYQKIKEKRIEEAKAYLDLIKKGNECSTEKVNVEELDRLLALSINHECKNSILSDYQEECVKKDSPKTVAEKVENERRYLSKMHEKLKQERGIILLPPMEEERIEQILRIAKEMKEFNPFVIEVDQKKQIVLRNKPSRNQFYNTKRLIDESNESYRNKDYEKAIEANYILIEITSSPRSVTYYKTAICFLMNRNKKKAIDYLTVAVALAKTENKQNEVENYTSLLLSLQGLIKKPDQKPSIHINHKLYQMEFNDVNNFYQMTNMEKIASSMIETGMDLEKVAQEFQLTEEQKDLTKLIYAREYYIQGNFLEGDKYLASVEKNKEKTKKVRMILNEIKKNRKFYQNRQLEESRLVLIKK